MVINSEEVEIKNIEILTEEEREVTKKILSDYLKKIKRLVKDSPKIKAHIKEYNKEGKQKKFSINIDLHFSGRRLKSDAADWDLAKTLHKCMIKIQNEIEHIFHTSDKR